MTTAVGTSWLDQMLATGWVSATVRCYLLSSTSSFNPTLHKNLSQVPVIDRVAGPVTLTGKTALGGYFDATVDPVFTLANGVTAKWFIAVFVGASEALSPIIVATDERAGDAELAIVGNGGQVKLPFTPLGVGRI